MLHNTHILHHGYEHNDNDLFERESQKSKRVNMRCSSCRISPNFSVYLWHKRKRGLSRLSSRWLTVSIVIVALLLVVQRFFSRRSSLLYIEEIWFLPLLFVLSCDYVCMSKETTLSGFVILFLSFLLTHREILIEFEHFSLSVPRFNLSARQRSRAQEELPLSLVDELELPLLAWLPTFTFVTPSSSL